MPYQFKNNVLTVLVNNITAVTNPIEVADGSIFPTATDTDPFFLTIEDLSANKIEICKCTNVSGNFLTVERGADNSTAQDFFGGTFVQMRVNAGVLEAFTQNIYDTVKDSTDPRGTPAATVKMYDRVSGAYDYEVGIIAFSPNHIYDSYGDILWIDTNGYYRQYIEGSIEQPIDQGYLIMGIRNPVGENSYSITLSEKSDNIELRKGTTTLATFGGATNTAKLYYNNVQQLQTFEFGINIPANGAAAATVHIGSGRTAIGSAYIDLVGDTTYTDYGLRVARDSTGPDTSSTLTHRGLGAFALKAQEAAPLQYYTNNLLRGYVAGQGGFVWGTPTGGQKGTGSINAQTIYQNDVQVAGLTANTFTDTQVLENAGTAYFRNRKAGLVHCDLNASGWYASALTGGTNHQAGDYFTNLQGLHSEYYINGTNYYAMAFGPNIWGTYGAGYKVKNPASNIWYDLYHQGNLRKSLGY